ncbi:MAG: DUF2283 domain-containing protein [Myxococcales bacterium]|nr:DUF2283 domain-containing protein [Myxococcales bacterium]
MKRPYLEVTFRKGRPIAAYLYLPRPIGAKAARIVEVRPHIVVDYAASGEPIGVELVAPSTADIASVNQVLSEIGAALLESEDLAPLRAA